MKKRTQAEKQQLYRQIFCLIMAALMLLGTLAAVIPYVSAADVPETVAVSAAAPAAEQMNEEEPDNGLLLRIGLMFGSNVTESFAIRAADGFQFGHTDKNNAFTPFYMSSDPYIAVCKNDNLSKTDNGYYVPDTKNVVIGGYHLQLQDVYTTIEAITAAVDDTNIKLKNAGIYSSLIYAFPYCEGGNLYVCVGDFGSGDSARAKIAAVEAALSKTPAVINPRKDTMTVISVDRNLILFAYREGSGKLGIAARPHITYQDGIETVTENPIITPAENGYLGIFLFGRYENGISVTNLIELEHYVAGVLPYEINNTWSYESQKAFACIIRSYTLANRGKHTSLGIDLCNGTDCQVYMGLKNQNETVLRAVDETRGTVITYDGKICNTFYSAVTGGSTVNVEQIWNGRAYPYLRAVETPWEDYASHPRGVWMTEVSPYNLFLYLSQNKGYKKLTGSIADVRIVELAENSSYVYKLDITDVNGNTVSLKGTDIIRTTLGRYLNSANFVVGYKGEIPILDKQPSLMTPQGIKQLSVTETENKKTTQILTADGIREIDVTDGVPVIGYGGETKVLTQDTAVYDIPEDAFARLNVPDNGNFLFIGKGWGHGGGISQWGAKNMAEQGACYDEIIHAYFTDVVLCDYRTLQKDEET